MDALRQSPFQVARVNRNFVLVDGTAPSRPKTQNCRAQGGTDSPSLTSSVVGPRRLSRLGIGDGCAVLCWCSFAVFHLSISLGLLLHHLTHSHSSPLTSTTITYPQHALPSISFHVPLPLPVNPLLPPSVTDLLSSLLLPSPFSFPLLRLPCPLWWCVIPCPLLLL